MANLQFEINSPIEPEKLMNYLTDFESFQQFFPAQIKSIKIYVNMVAFYIVM